MLRFVKISVKICVKLCVKIRAKICGRVVKQAALKSSRSCMAAVKLAFEDNENMRIREEKREMIEDKRDESVKEKFAKLLIFLSRILATSSQISDLDI